MSKRKEDVWHKGPPLHVGWWNASRTRNSGGRSWRWWDGKEWSSVVKEHNSPESAAYGAGYKAYHSDEKPIEWNTYYPKKARVPRIDPAKVKADKKPKLRLVA